MFEIVIESVDGIDQQTFGPFDTWSLAWDYMPAVVIQFGYDFAWMQIQRVKD